MSNLFITTGETSPFAKRPTAVAVANPLFGVIGSVVRLDGRGSSDPEGKLLSYEWSFLSIPIGSKVRREGFRTLDEDRGLVSFSPDVVGEYVVGLRVSNGLFTSEQVQVSTSIRAILVPHGRGLVPDGKFIWSYLRDVWAEVEGKEFFETLWSALIQITGSEMLKLYQTDFNKSIRDIQDQFQRRWLAYEPRLELEDAALVLGRHRAGTDASTAELPSPNESAFTDTFAVADTEVSDLLPGRLVTVGGQSFVLSRVTVKEGKALVTVEGQLPTGLRSLSWRMPHTLISKTQDFEALGVCPGDQLLCDVTLSDAFTVAEVAVRVVGVAGKRLGFVLTDGEVLPGIIPPVPHKTYLSLSQDLGIPTVTLSRDGILLLSGEALQLSDAVESSGFARAYHNRELAPGTDIAVGKLSFRLRPKSLVRNRMVPVDAELRSVPLLQEYIVQPDVVERDGKIFRLLKSGEVEMPRKPVSLVENVDFIIDGRYAYEGGLTFRTGSSLIECDDGDFLDRNVTAGDTLTIVEPLPLAGDYPILSVPGQHALQLAREVPLYALRERVTAQVRITRKRDGHFLRFVPGLFTAETPAPSRLWAEVSFFDNGENIENNFGLLVALTRENLEAISTNINYRQAVAGLMYAYTRGPALDRVRLGAQILLGLPFSEHRGIIRSIDEDYRLDDAGAPVLGRILVEDVSAEGEPQGTLRVYTYPIDPVSDLAGVETNPATGKAYRVGDSVDLFAPLSKGVEVSDYLTDPLDVPAGPLLLQQFHAIRVRANDNIFSLKELEFVSGFLKRITPSYIAFYISSASEFADTVEVRDTLTNALSFGQLVDMPGVPVPVVPMVDARSTDGILQMLLDEGVFTVRRSGSDLTTVAGTSDAQLALGGLVDHRSHELTESPVCEPGDRLLIRGGPDAGLYPISALADTQATVSGTTFVGGTDFRYAVLRKVKSLAYVGLADTLAADPLVDVPEGSLRTRGVSPGDWLILDGKRYLIDGVLESQPGTRVWDRLRVTPAPAATIASVPIQIFRPTLFESPSLETYQVTSDGTNTLTTSTPALRALLDIGDELQVQDAGLSRVQVLDATGLYIVPALPAGTYTVRICKPGLPSASLMDLGSFFPKDSITLGLQSASYNPALGATNLLAQKTAGSTEVPLYSKVNGGATTPINPLALGIRPGDLFINKDTSASSDATRDVGYGPGAVPVVRVTSTAIHLSLAALSNVEFTWKILRSA